MFANRYFEGYWGYKYDRNRLWILEQTQDSYWTKNSSLKDYRMKRYVQSNEEDTKIMEAPFLQNDIDLIEPFKAQCLNYVDIPMMSHLLSLKHYDLSHHLSSQIILSISRCLDIRRQIALNRTCKNRLKDARNRRSLSDKNTISESELEGISSIVEIGIKSNYAMLNAVSSSKQSNKLLLHKILSVLTRLLSALGPLSLKKHPFHSLQSLLIEFCSNPTKYQIEIQYPLRALLALTLCQATLDTTIHTINAMFDAVLQSKHTDALKLKAPSSLYELISKSFAITLESPNQDLVLDSFHVSLSVPTPFGIILDSNRQSMKKEQTQIATEDKKEENTEAEDGEDEKVDPNQEKKLLKAKRKAIEARLTEFIAQPTGGAVTSYKSYLIYLNDKGLHKIGTGYHTTKKGHVYGTVKDICLANDNIAWMTTWISLTHSWILIRFRYDPHKKDDQLCGRIYVIDADKFVILGEMHQNGEGTIETENNTKYESLGRITTAVGPIFVSQETNRLCALQFEETEDDVCTLKLQQFELPKLKYVDNDLEVYGPATKGSMKRKQTDDATAFGWGQNGSGGLGVNDTSAKYTPTPLQFLPKLRLDRCFAGNETSFFVTSAGAVYANGRNGSGQLGLGQSNLSNQLKPQLIKGLTGHRIIKISGSRHGSHTVFLSDKGKVFGAGNNGNGQVKTANDHSVGDPYCINDKDEELLKITKKKGKKWLFFVDVAAATNRTAAVTKNGELYCWGNNNRRSMGLDAEQAFRHPTLEKRLAEKLKLKLVRIDMGHSFSLSLDSKGDCYAVGDGSYGQLGLGDTGSKTEWSKVPFQGKWKDISCGYYHGMGIAKKKKDGGGGQMYTWGNNQNGQLGIGSRTRQTTPTPVTSFNKNERICFIQGGGFFSTCLTINGDVYVWGSNSYGEQGQGDTTTRQQPIKVTTDGFDEHKIRSLAAGYYHCLAIPENRDPPIGRNTLHDMRWYNAPHKIGCLMRRTKQLRIYDQDENRVFTTKEVEYEVRDNAEPMDITYNPYNHNVYAVYAPANGDADHLVIQQWMNGSHLELSKERLVWESEYFLTHPDYLLDIEDSERDGSSLISITVNFIACIDLMIKSKLIDPYSDEDERVEEWKYFYDAADKRPLTLVARCLCIGADQKVFESLIQSVIASWNTLKKIWIVQNSNEYSITTLFRARIYVLIALFRILSFNVKMFSIKSSGLNNAEDATATTNRNMKDLGDALFRLLSDVTNTVDAHIESKKRNPIEVQALNAVQAIAQQTFKYAFNVFYASFNDRAQFLMSVIEDIRSDTLRDVSFKTIGVENILKSSQLSNLYAVCKKDDKLYEYIKDKKDGKEEKKGDDDEEDDNEDTTTARHHVIDSLLPFIIAPDLHTLDGVKAEKKQQVEAIRTLVFKLIASIQVDMNNKVAFEILKSEAKDGNPSKIFILSFKIVSESNALLSKIIQHKEKDPIIQQSKLLRYLLPSAIQSFQPFIERLQPSKHVHIFEALHELNETLNRLNKERGIELQEKKESDDQDEIMVIESEHPYVPTKCKRYVAEFEGDVHAVMINFDIRCKFRTEEDQLVIGFPENPNYFHGPMTHSVPGTLIVPSNKILISFASYGSTAQRTEDPPTDALQKRWGFRLYLAPQRLVRPHYLYSLQMAVCDMLANIAFLESKQTDQLKLESKQSLRFPKPAALYSSDLLKNGLEPTEDADDTTDDSKQDIEVQSFLNTLLTNQNEEDGWMDNVRKQFSTASPAHSVVIDDLKARTDIFGGVPSEITIKVCDEQNQPVKLLEEKTCAIKAQLFKKIERKPREEERDWTKEVSWSQYDKKSMDFKCTQFAICYDGDDSIYIVGGYKEGNVDSKDCYKYSMKEDKYTKLPSLEFAVKCHTIRMLKDGRVLSMGGNTSHCAIYDPSANKWDYALNTDENKKNFGAGSRFVMMENTDGDEIAHCIGGSKYVEDDNEEKKADDKDGGDKHWTYNINKNEWKLMEKRCPTKVKYHGLLKDAFNRIYCFGGKPNGQQMHCFDTDSSEWHRCPDIPVDVCSFGTCFDGDTRYILLCGGSDSVQPHAGSRQNHFYIYDTLEGEWKKSDHNLPYGVKNTECLVIGKRCHLFGGSNGSPLNKHAIGTANMELKEENRIQYYHHKEANEDWKQLVEKETQFKVVYGNKGSDGVATIQWTPFIHGTYFMDVMMDGQAIKNSPYSIDVRPLCDLCVPQHTINDTGILDQWAAIHDAPHAYDNAFRQPSKPLFIYDDADPYTLAFVQYAESLTYVWQSREMPSDYNASLSTGVYGSYALKEIESVEIEDIALDTCMSVSEVQMPRHYKASYHSGVYGSYALKGMPLRYLPSYNSGVYGVYRYHEEEEEDEDTFNALFKEMEKHATYKKNADAYGNVDNLDTEIRFGGAAPKKWLMNGVRVELQCGPYQANAEDAKEKEEPEKEDKPVDLTPPVALSSISAHKAMRCVFLTLIKHLGFGEMFYKWSRNELIDPKQIAWMSSIWKHSCRVACDILREREDFPPQKGEIKTKEMMDYKKKDVKDLLEEFRKKRNELRQDNKEEENDKKEEENEKKEKEKKVFVGVCKAFDVNGGFGIIVVDDEAIEDIKVDKKDIFGDYGNSTLAVGEKVQFEIIENADGVKEAVCCTGVDGAFVTGMKAETEAKKEDDTHDGFDGFTRGYTHLHKQCQVLISIRHSSAATSSMDADLEANTIYKSIQSILALDESVDLKELRTLIRDRTKVALQKERAFHMFSKLLAANDISEAFYLTILWYFYQSLALFSFPAHSKYRNKPEIWDAKLEEHIKQRKYSLSNKRFKAHYLSDVDGVSVAIVKRLKVVFWDMVESAITLANTTYPQSIALKHRITSICCMDWRKHDFDYFKQTISDSKQSIIQYLYSLSHKKSIKMDDSISFWNEDIFGTHIWNKEMEARKSKKDGTQNKDGIIREELPSLTWFAPMDLDEKLFVADVEDKCMRLNVHTIKQEKDGTHSYTLGGEGSCPLIANGVAFEGEYRPYDKDKAKRTIDLNIKCKAKELKIELASWSGNDPVKDGFNKSHIKINNGDNKQTTNYGFHFALINVFTGGYAKYKYFDIHSSESNVKPLVEFVKDLPRHHVIAITSYYSSGKYWKKEIYDALKVYGWSWEKVEDYESFIFVANTDATVYYQEKKTKSNGPLKKELTIPLQPTPDMHFNGGFADENTINGTWKFVYASKEDKDVWCTYVEEQKCKNKDDGGMDFTVSKELEDGWRWNESEDMKTVESPFYSYLSVAKGAYVMDASSNKNTLKNANDNDLESYWQSASSAKTHWISFQFTEEACLSGIGFYFNYQKDSNYVPEVLKVYVGAENKEDLHCIATRRVQREFKGIYVVQLDSNEIALEEDKEEEKDRDHDNDIKINQNGYIKCKYFKVEWLYKTQSKYARVRQIFLYSKKINEFDDKIRSCFIQNDQLLSANIWQCTNLLCELEKEYDGEWMKKKQTKHEASTQNSNEVKGKDKEKKSEESGDMDIEIGLFGDEDEYSDEDW